MEEADGYQPHLIAPEMGYRRLLQECLILFKGPAEVAVDEVSQFMCSTAACLHLDCSISHHLHAVITSDWHACIKAQGTEARRGEKERSRSLLSKERRLCMQGSAIAEHMCKA